MSDKLEPCPCCRGEAKAVDGYPLAMVKCTGCGLRMLAPTLAQAVIAWNTRASGWRPIEEYKSGWANFYYPPERTGRHPSNYLSEMIKADFVRPSGYRNPTMYQLITPPEKSND